MLAVNEVLKSEFARLDAAELDLIRRYRVACAAELEKLIVSRQVPEHPSWEDLIEWEAIEARRRQLKEYASKLEGEAVNAPQ